MRSAMVAVAMLAGCVLTLVGCGDGSHEATEKDVFNAYFYYPPTSKNAAGSEVFLGKVTGISACQSAARGFASSKNLLSNRDWSYICCREAHGSSCYDKHR